MKVTTFLSAASLAGAALGAVCPLEAMKRSGMLSAQDEAKFEAVKRDPKLAEELVEAQKRAGRATAQVVGPKKKNGTLDLPCGGGLLNGALQPLTNQLEGIPVPVAQAQGLKEIPGNDTDHQFRAPGPTDVRGACPALNTLANHGYISHNGITRFADAANAVQTGFGFSFPLATVLSALGLLVGGDLATGIYSIGGADSRVPNTYGPALGLTTHNALEVDGSITRADANSSNPATFVLQRWNEYNAIATKNGNFNTKTQAQDSALRYDNSRKTNPGFFAGIMWLVTAHAMRYFVAGGFANGTQGGLATYSAVAPFFLNESFPSAANTGAWSRRGSPLTLAQTVQGARSVYEQAPRALGGNQPNSSSSTGFSFVPLKATTPAGNAACFFVQNVVDLAPFFVHQPQSSELNATQVYEGFVKGVIAPFFIADGYFNCPATLYDPPPKPGSIVTKADNRPGQSAARSPVNGA